MSGGKMEGTPMAAILFEMAELAYTNHQLIIDEAELAQDLEEALRMAGVKLIWADDPRL